MGKMEEGIEKDIQIDLISDEIICRVDLETDRAFEFAQLMEAGTKFPRIIVREKADGSYVVQDGRTRLHAYTLSLAKMVPCIVLPKCHSRDILIAAYNGNCGGSQPPNRADLKYTIMTLVGLKTPKKIIMGSFPIYPHSFIERQYLAAICSIQKKKIGKAIDAMQKNPKLSIEAAAELFDLPTNAISQVMKSRAGNGGRKSQIASIIKTKYKYLTNFSAQNLKVLMNRYMDGEATADEAHDILVVFVECAGRLMKNITNWQNRFAKVDGPGNRDVFPLNYTTEKTEAGYVMKPK